jgi:uncharacterized membrane protein YfcA
MDPGLLRRVIPWLLILIVVYFLVTPRLGHDDIRPRLSPTALFMTAGLVLGFYDGFFGPGTGSFWVMALMLGLGLNIIRATSCTKVMNFSSNASSLAVFLISGSVHWREGLVMGVGQYFGARLGARLVVTRGARFVRPVFITMVLAVSARLIWQNLR